jgi:hypothetical protein
MSAQIHGTLASLLRRPGPIEQTPTLPVQVPKTIGLEPVRQAAKQEMARKGSRRWRAEHGMPTAAKLDHVETTQARNLDIELGAVRQRWTDFHPRHGRQAGRRWGRRELGVPLFPLTIW